MPISIDSVIYVFSFSPFLVVCHATLKHTSLFSQCVCPSVCPSVVLVATGSKNLHGFKSCLNIYLISYLQRFAAKIFSKFHSNPLPTLKKNVRTYHHWFWSTNKYLLMCHTLSALQTHKTDDVSLHCCYLTCLPTLTLSLSFIYSFMHSFIHSKRPLFKKNSSIVNR